MISLDDTVMKHIYRSTKLSIKFQIKITNKQQYKHDLTYNLNFPECRDNYLGGIGKIFCKMGYDHDEKHKRSIISKHSYGKHHANVSIKYFQILGNNCFKSSLLDNLFIEGLSPSLNTQQTSVALKRFSSVTIFKLTGIFQLMAGISYCFVSSKAFWIPSL